MNKMLVLCLLVISGGLPALAVGEPAPAPDREARLASAVESFSQQGWRGGATSKAFAESLWNLSGKDMALALRFADRVEPAGARFQIAYFLCEKQPGAYYSYRRPRQFLAAVLLGLPFCLLLLRRRFRHGAGLIAGSVFAWGLWSLACQDFRQLPPEPYPFLTTSFLALASVGLTGALATCVPWGKLVSSRGIELAGRVGATAAFAGVLATAACLFSRWTGLFPKPEQGWDLFLEAYGALMLGILAGGLLAALDTLLPWLRQAKKPDAMWTDDPPEVS